MSGAQVRIPLDSSVVRIPVGQVYVLPERCKGCRFCIEFCPEQVLAESEVMNAKGYHYPVVVAGKELACVNCRFCIDFCPEQVLAESEVMNAKGYHYPVVVAGKELACVNCRFCKLICPEFAIYTEEL